MVRILIVEDSKIIRNLYKKRFKSSLNTAFDYAASYDEAVNLSLNNDYDLFIVDFILGEGKTGVDFIKILKSKFNIYNRVVFVSGNEDEEFLVNSYNLGVSNVLPKPINFKVLTAVLNKNIKMIESQSNFIKYDGDFIYDSQKMIFKEKVNGDFVPLNLTQIESKILFKLISSKSAIVSKDNLSSLGKSYNEPMSDKAIEMHIKNLRSKSKYISEHLQTKRGFGYILE